MKPEEPISAIITSRFDLGFIVRHPNGRFGQLRVPEMCRSTAECDCSLEDNARIGRAVQVYVVLETDDGYLFSEFSTEERSARDQKHVDWIKAQEQAAVGHTLLVRVEQKLEWGCICRQEQEPFLEGVILTPETVFKNHLPPQCSVAGSVLHRLTNGSSVSVVITHKRWDHGCYILYFSFPDSSPDVKDG